MTARKRRYRTEILCLLVLGGVSAILFLRNQTRSPLDRATRVNAPLTLTSEVELESSGWMPPDRFLGFHEDERSWHAYSFDMRTAKQVRLESLHKLVVSRHSWKPWSVRYAVSPNGKWLLWGHCGPSGPSDYFVAALDGSEIKAWHYQTRKNPCQIGWQADSNGWMLLNPDKKFSMLDSVRVYSLNADTPPRTVSFRGMRIGYNMIGRLPGNLLMTCDNTIRRFSIFSLDAPAKTLRTIDIEFSKDDQVGQALPSQNGERMAWIVQRPLNWPRWLFGGGGSVPNIQARIMISNLDGSHLREMGRFNAFVASHGGDRYKIYGWSADSNRLLLMREKALWWLPVDN